VGNKQQPRQYGIQKRNASSPMSHIARAAEQSLYLPMYVRKKHYNIFFSKVLAFDKATRQPVITVRQPYTSTTMIFSPALIYNRQSRTKYQFQIEQIDNDVV